MATSSLSSVYAFQDYLFKLREANPLLASYSHMREAPTHPPRGREGPSQARHPAHHRKDGSCPVLGQSLATAQEGTPLGDGHSSFIVNALLRGGYRLDERGVPFRRRVRVEEVQAPQRLRMVLEPDPLQLPLT